MTRADQFLVEQGFAASRSEAQAAIRAGLVRVDGAVLDKASRSVADHAAIQYRKPHPFVSRGGIKLAAALEHFTLSPEGRVALDIGASTGGFTEVLLGGGAEKVYAIDVGHAQMNPILARDKRVTARDGVNARDLTGAHVPQPPQAITADVSFIGLKLALPPALEMAASGAWLLALVKPQFEVGRDWVGKGGIVRDTAAQEEALREIAAWLGGQKGWTVLGTMESPIQGGDGNKEFFVAAQKIVTLCRHFGTCGGCALQDLTPDDYRAFKRQTVTDALARAGLGETRVEEAVQAPLQSRRRAVFKLAKAGDILQAGFYAARSHAIVDMRECRVLTPGLFALVASLRTALAPILKDGEKAELHATETESGFDLAFRSPRKLTPALTGAIAAAFSGVPVARILFNDQIVLEQQKPSIHLGGVKMNLPPQAFLKATQAGEAALQARVLALTSGAKNIADLFAGVGTFSLALAARARVHAIEQDGAALQALAAAARGAQGLKPVTTEKRDLFKSPLTPLELAPYDAVVLDPPRAGAEAQTKALAASKIARVAYVSCDAASFARDARILADAGFVAGPVAPIDQFLFSLHIELVAGFTREKPGRGSDRG